MYQKYTDLVSEVVGYSLDELNKSCGSLSLIDYFWPHSNIVMYLESCFFTFTANSCLPWLEKHCENGERVAADSGDTSHCHIVFTLSAMRPVLTGGCVRGPYVSIKPGDLLCQTSTVNKCLINHICLPFADI